MSVDMRSLTEQLILHEGLRQNPYYCTAGKLTIGVGRNLEAVGISKSEAMFMLENDIIRVMAELDEHLSWWRDLGQTRRHVLVDMAFNLGIFGLMKFQNALKAMQEERFADAAVEMLDSRWAQQVGNRAKTLAKMMETDSE